MFNSCSDRKRLCLHKYSAFIEHFKGISCTMTYCKNNIICFDYFGGFSMLNFSTDNSIVLGENFSQFGFKENLSAERYYLFTNILDSRSKLVRTNMRLGKVENILGSTIFNKLLKNFSCTGILSASIQLSIRKSSCTALTKLNI